MKKHFCTLIIICWGLTCDSQPIVGFTSFLTGLTAPVDIANAHDGSNRLFIVGQDGIIRVHTTSGLLSTPFLDMSALVTYSGEQGLLSMAFHPDYANNRYFFVYYNNVSGDVELAQYRTSASNANLADTGSRKIMLTVSKPFTNHNGGKLNFGPDSNLYLGIGDGGGGGDPFNNAQNLNSYLGKMLRINVDSFNTAPYYTVPATNPLVGVSGTKPEIYDWGLRNPWRWSFDSQTGDMWIADVGQSVIEEVNMTPAASTSGQNFGWRCYEGDSTYDLSLCGATPLSGKTFPIYEYPHSSSYGFCITGGYVYRGTQYPALQGYYLCADYFTGNGWLIKPGSPIGWTVLQQTNFPGTTTTFGEAEDGTLYLTNGSAIYEIIVAAVLPIDLLSFKAVAKNDLDILDWRVSSADPSAVYEIQRSTDGNSYSTIGALASKKGRTDYQFTADALTSDRLYRIKLLSNGGVTAYSTAIRLLGQARVKITWAAMAPGKIQLNTPVDLERVVLINSQGQQLQCFEKLGSGRQVLDLGTSVPGIYLLRCIKNGAQVENLKIKVY